MARTFKKGLDYFPLDIDIFNDLKIRKLIKYQGGKAITVYALLLCNIYKSGYYIKWDKELPFICSELTGFEEAYISEVIKTCLTLGLFSKELFDAEKVLTSKGIQERYSRICVQCRRVCYIGDYNLIEKRKPKQTEKLPRKNDNPQTIQGSTTVQNELQYEPYSMTIDEEIAELKKTSVGLTNYKCFMQRIFPLCAAVLTTSGCNAWQTGKTGILPYRMPNSTSTHG